MQMLCNDKSMFCYGPLSETRVNALSGWKSLLPCKWRQ